FYLIGSRGVTDWVGGGLSEIFRALGAGSRFESIERGVIDLRDLVYYLSLAVMFLSFNVISLDSKRWSAGGHTRTYRRNMLLAGALIAANLIVLNVWLFNVTAARADITQQREYSLSPVTKDLLANLQEPLLIRGYFSQKTHPLLAPLVPQIRDMLEEYRIASNGNVQIEIVDPVQEPDLEREANQTYGIQPTPLQAADRYGASVVNAYFDLLVRYGDQYQTLNFRDLIDVQTQRNGQPEVRLRNFEYDLTRAIKKSVYGFQSIDNVLAGLEKPANLTLYYTPDALPGPLAEAADTIQKVAGDIQAKSGGKFIFNAVNVDDPNSGISRKTLQEQYGLRPIPVALFSDQTYYLHMILDTGNGQPALLFPSGDLTEADIRTTIESALKRTSTGFLKTVGVWTPQDTPTPNAFGQMSPGFKRYDTAINQLRNDYNVRPVDLSNGQVPAGIDVLLVIAPQGMTEKQQYAVDQFLMRGGSVIVAAGNYVLNPDQFTGDLGIQPVDGGLRDLLAGYGINVEQSLVMDPQNEPFPVQIARNLGGMQVREVQALNYPFFVDVRPDGMAKDNPILANLPAVTLNWVSPVQVDEQKNAERDVTVLLKSSPASWLRTDTNIQPDMQTYPELGFPVEGTQQSYPLAVAVQGVFESAFKGKASPLVETTEPGTEGPSPDAANPQNLGTIEQSPDSARLVVIGSAEFLNDIVFDLSSRLTGDRYLNTLQFAQNTVDWSVEDLDLLTIRSRGTSARLLNPLTPQQQSFWEITNYALALLALLVLAVVWRVRQKNEKPMELHPPRKQAAGGSQNTAAHAAR
ncbi:MAG: ABC transporter permease, partial [Chloroflexi bacterium]